MRSWFNRLQERRPATNLALTLLVAVLSGCSLFHKNTTAAPPQAKAPSATAPNSLIVAPAASGKVASINTQGRYAVLIFPLGQVPPINSRMVAYHGDAKAGEVKITGPTQDNFTVGDIVLGTVLEGDEVRSE